LHIDYILLLLPSLWYGVGGQNETGLRHWGSLQLDRLVQQQPAMIVEIMGIVEIVENLNCKLRWQGLGPLK
jgi:hypothetical protein